MGHKRGVDTRGLSSSRYDNKIMMNPVYIVGAARTPTARVSPGSQTPQVSSDD